ncbi:HutD/Ves family protein [Marilutibacter chinensis]|uniref:HutD family protein n=1 Tax=Marilutibacter chinensis TaxID=2912247 RepID=A0ABS9HU82_9GAMM|nr:HutD family protein [Lysobacter chinensis]MCF7222444.1 HutD family protein [Lysobacter chinensis]
MEHDANPHRDSWIVPSHACLRTRWRNGLGWTREIAQGRLRSAGDEASDATQGSTADEGWDWRLSVAEIDGEAPFSRFDGVEREQMLLSGNGLRLRRAAGETVLHPPHDRLRFTGEEVMVGCPLDGRVEVVNLMWRRARVDAASWHRPLVGPMVIFVEPGSTWLIHLIGGQGMFTDGAGPGGLEAGDTAVLAAGRTRLRHVLEGGGEAWVIRLCRAEATGRTE